MAVNVSTVSNPLWTTIAVDTDADLDLETFNDANTTLYALEIVNPNGKAVWARFNWANSGGSTSTQNDNIFYCPANSECSTTSALDTRLQLVSAYGAQLKKALVAVTSR